MSSGNEMNIKLTVMYMITDVICYSFLSVVTLESGNPGNGGHTGNGVTLVTNTGACNAPGSSMPCLSLCS